MAEFSFAAWRRYCEDRVRPQHSEFPERLKRLDRLLGRDTEGTWRTLAGDLNPNWPAHLDPLTWQDALHNVIGTLIFPPTPAGTADKAHYRKWRRDAGRPAHFPLPIMPAPATRRANAERNWLALYLKTWIFPAMFRRRHYEEIAALVDCALGLPGDFSADQVRFVQPWHFRKSYRVRS